MNSAPRSRTDDPMFLYQVVCACKCFKSFNLNIFPAVKPLAVKKAVCNEEEVGIHA